MKILSPTSLFCMLALLPVQALAEDVDESRSIAPDATVSISNVAGEIQISVWDRNEVHLTGILGNNQELDITENANGIQIEVLHIDDNEDFDEAELVLVIPLGASIVAEGVSADILIEGSSGASISAESVSGDVTVQADTSRVELSTVSGDLEFKGSSRRCSVETVSGDIILKGISGEISVSTVSGDTELQAGVIDQGKFETVSGSLDRSMSVSDGGRLTVEGMNGDVELWLRASQPGDFSAQTFSGDISSDFGSVKSESFGPGSHLKHSKGDSGTGIRVETFSGDIHIGHK